MAASDRTRDLEKFVSAQDAGGCYERAIAEIRSGRKMTHWIWFIFPQLAGLGTSVVAQRYAIASITEARAYLNHPILGPRLIECAEAVAESNAPEAEHVFGALDALKVRSSMTLFARAAPSNPVFTRVLSKYFDGVTDHHTEALLDRSADAQS